MKISSPKAINWTLKQYGYSCHSHTSSPFQTLTRGRAWWGGGKNNHIKYTQNYPTKSTNLKMVGHFLISGRGWHFRFGKIYIIDIFFFY
jgi:hypothetical protein